MYQWKEEKKEDTQTNVGGGTTTTITYDYTRVWSHDPINSSEQASGEPLTMRRYRSAMHSLLRTMPST